MRYLYKKEFYYENLPPIEHLGVINSILTKIYSLNNGSILRTLYRGAKPGVGTSGSWAEWRGVSCLCVQPPLLKKRRSDSGDTALWLNKKKLEYFQWGSSISQYRDQLLCASDGLWWCRVQVCVVCDDAIPAAWIIISLVLWSSEQNDGTEAAECWEQTPSRPRRSYAEAAAAAVCCGRDQRKRRVAPRQTKEAADAKEKNQRARVPRGYRRWIRLPVFQDLRGFTGKPRPPIRYLMKS